MKRKSQILFIVLLCLLLVGCGNKNNGKVGNNEKGQNKSDSVVTDSANPGNITLDKVKILKSYIGGENYILTKDGIIYTNNSKDGSKIQKSSANVDKVKDFDNGYYLTLDNNIIVDNEYYEYLSTIKYDNRFEKIQSDVVSMATFSSGCLVALNSKNEVLAFNLLGNLTNQGTCGFSKEYNFEKVAENAKYVLAGFNYSGYIDNNDDLYIKLTTDSEYKKVITGVKKVIGNHALTKSGIYYNFPTSSSLKDTKFELYEQLNNVSDVIPTTDGNLMIKMNDKVCFGGFSPKNDFMYEEKRSNIDGSNFLVYGCLNLPNSNQIKDVLFLNQDNAFVYVDNNDIIHYYNGKEVKKANLARESLSNYFSFVNGLSK